MKINQSVQLDNGSVKFEGELNQLEADAIINMGLSVALASGAFPEIQKALKEAQKQEEADQGYDFPHDMVQND